EVAYCSRLASARRAPPLEPHETAHVVGEIGEANLHPRTGEADRPDNEAHQSLMREDMFDRRADLRFSRIGDSYAFRQRPALRLLAMDARYEAAFGQHLLVLRRSIGRVRPNLARGVLLVQHIGQARAIEGCRIARRP